MAASLLIIIIRDTRHEHSESCGGQTSSSVQWGDLEQVPDPDKLCYCNEKYR